MIEETPVSAPVSRRPSRLRRVAADVLAVLVPTALIAAHGGLYGRWIVDDAAITFAYARSVAEGAGPVLQPGADPVEGFSNPAWLALLVAGRWLGLFDHGTLLGIPDYAAYPKALAYVLVAVLFAAFQATARALGPRPTLVTLGAGVVLALIPSFVIWVVSGLENSLLAATVAVLGAILARAAVSGRLLSPWVGVAAGLAAALAALTRPDGLIYAGAYPIVVLLFLRRAALGRSLGAIALGLAAFAVPAGTYLAWRVVTFGEVLPNTALAKSQGLPAAEDLNRPAELVSYLGWLPLALGAGVVGAVLTRSGPFRRGLLSLLVLLGLALASFVVLEPDWMAQLRFATPVWAMSALVVAVAVVRIIRLAGWRGRVAAVLVAGVVVVGSGGFVVDHVQRFRASPTVPMCLVASTGGAIQGYADVLGLRSGSVLVPDIGGVALTTRMQVVDMVGLADARIARYWRDDDMPGLRDHVFDEARPTFLTSHSVWSVHSGLLEDPRLARDYALITGSGTRGHWVRRDALPSPDALARLQTFAATAVVPGDSAMRAAPLASCGPRLGA